MQHKTTHTSKKVRNLSYGWNKKVHKIVKCKVDELQSQTAENSEVYNLVA